MISIPLTQGKSALVDSADFPLISKYKWHYSSGYAKTKSGKITMHRFLMKPKKNQQIDHINGNRLDNTRKNMRICSPQENSMNRKLNRNNNCGFKGVSFAPLQRGNKKWRARISFEGKNISLGYFDTPEKASVAYNTASVTYHGDFSKNKMCG